MISHALSEGERYGVLKEANLGGAMLYGPPGTGKTHLARVLAKESAASMINITAAEIESKWTGETEGRIKALFNLARLLSPCIIFIDEADSLLKARQVDDKSWERSRISQFLTEMDGLKTQDRDSNGNHPPPFLILSTNYPSSIDHAIMRRVPGRFYLGPPTSESRRTIIGSLMRDEDVDPTVHFSDLAKQTDGFSGSDLQTLCVEAASISQSRLGTYSSRRLVTMADFANALYLVRPTITRQAMKDLERFAKDYDP
ncbi:P-loop containing nucleoside triphosphate hydrolase protein, partial [Stachybotrys elegans]